jgi:hypothetical protein
LSSAQGIGGAQAVCGAAGVQWIVAAITAIFVAAVAFLQWRTAQQKAVLDLFDRRYAIYEIVRKAVGTITTNSSAFDQSREIEFMQAMAQGSPHFLRKRG